MKTTRKSTGSSSRRGASASKGRAPAKRRAAKRRTPRDGRKWSAKVTRTSDAMTLEKDIFKSNDPKKIARSVKRSSEHSHRRKTNPYRSAVSMISFFENRAGSNLSASKRRTLQAAKQELKKAFHRE
ncbi:DUF3175 domain-containing protein [Horticoccus luteus]|uniref:DUF3175 domain-containing protein n=1 Tax=Horticoccus luteus TaxID=2862869 RepID=A0A8F9TUC5_9BACT|nr:DUF3175 domain-containing protein [Horticoccus luteus]QYM78448.1 DUF3175 domain-containing protein [Horticoccus luteus]